MLLPPQPLPRIMAAEDIIPTTKRNLEQYRAVYNAVAERITHTGLVDFGNVVQPLIDVENQIQGEMGVVAMLRYASLDPAAREASDQAVQLMHESHAEFVHREDFFRLVEAVRDKDERLLVEAKKYLDSLFLDFRRCGHGLLDADQIKSYLDTRNRIDSLRSRFNRNIRDDDSGLWFSLEELDGVPEQDVERFRKENQVQVQNQRTVRRFVPFQKAERAIILKYARNPATRKKMYVADAHTLAQNIDIFKEVITLRDRNARLLGYSSHAAFRLEKRVARSPAWVDNFLAELQERKKAYILANTTDYPQEYPDIMPPWDYEYYSRLALDELQVDHNRIAEYFPLQTTVSAMFGLYSAYLQLRFVPVSPDDMAGSTWHEDVEAWSVWDEREESNCDFIGYLYTDLLSRPRKYKGNQNVNLQCVSEKIKRRTEKVLRRD